MALAITTVVFGWDRRMRGFITHLQGHDTVMGGMASVNINLALEAIRVMEFHSTDSANQTIMLSTTLTDIIMFNSTGKHFARGGTR